MRVARDDPAHRRTALTYVVFVGVAQVGWIVALVVNLPIGPTFALTTTLILIELAGPYVAEHGREGGTPWHPHHIAERYGLLVIITLGEVVLGTIIAISAVIQEQGWSAEAIAVALGGTLLAFALWWVSFTVPPADLLALQRLRLELQSHLLIAAIERIKDGPYLVLGALRVSAVTAWEVFWWPTGRLSSHPDHADREVVAYSPMNDPSRAARRISNQLTRDELRRLEERQARG